MNRKTAKSPINHLAPEGTKWCPRCEKFVDKTEFAGKKKLASYCSPCSKAWQKSNRGKNPERYVQQKFAQRLRRYNLTPDQYEELLARQGGGCAICKSEVNNMEMYRLHVDHDHTCCAGKESCGKCIRGILCANCNHGLGHFKDDLALLQAAIDYLSTITAPVT